MKSQEKLSSLEKLKLQKEALDARIKKIEQSEKTKRRKQETRKKVIVGEYYIEKLDKEGKMDDLKKAMDKFLTRKIDRELFGLKGTN